MRGLIRPFDRQQHDLCDKPGKDALRAYFQSLYYTVHHEPHGIHGVDLLVKTPNGQTFYCDAEVRVKAWPSGPFPFTSVHVVERKEKYTRLDAPVVFAALNGCLCYAVFVWGHELTRSRLVRNPVNPWEYVYDIPLSRVLQVRIHVEGTESEHKANDPGVGALPLPGGGPASAPGTG